MTTNDALIHAAAEAIRCANAIVIGAGAGMGVDSGMPDFRGPEGFWKAYPPYQKLGLNFVDLANPDWFDQDPALAWGFYGHRRNLYRRTMPHAGFAILRRWAERVACGAVVFTSNVDGHFQKAGFASDRIMEVHGSIHYSQCTRLCIGNIYPAEAEDITIDESTMRASEPLPRCPKCGCMARPNILMFGDMGWDGTRTMQQRLHLQDWVYALSGSFAIIECGAGEAIPTVRNFCERLAHDAGGRLIRINKREYDVPAGHIGLPMGALAALQAIDAALS